MSRPSKIEIPTSPQIEPKVDQESTQRFKGFANNPETRVRGGPHNRFAEVISPSPRGARIPDQERRPTGDRFSRAGLHNASPRDDRNARRFEDPTFSVSGPTYSKDELLAIFSCPIKPVDLVGSVHIVTQAFLEPLNLMELSEEEHKVKKDGAWILKPKFDDYRSRFDRDTEGNRSKIQSKRFAREDWPDKQDDRREDKWDQKPVEKDHDNVKQADHEINAQKSDEAQTIPSELSSSVKDDVAAETHETHSDSKGNEAELTKSDSSDVKPSCRQWWYRDPEGQAQGPFSDEDMREWYLEGFFTLQLPIRCDAKSDYLPLGAWFLSNKPAFLDHVPEVVERSRAERVMEKGDERVEENTAASDTVIAGVEHVEQTNSMLHGTHPKTATYEQINLRDPQEQLMVVNDDRDSQHVYQHEFHFGIHETGSVPSIEPMPHEKHVQHVHNLTKMDDTEWQRNQQHTFEFTPHPQTEHHQSQHMLHSDDVEFVQQIIPHVDPDVRPWQPSTVNSQDQYNLHQHHSGGSFSGEQKQNEQMQESADFILKDEHELGNEHGNTTERRSPEIVQDFDVHEMPNQAIESVTDYQQEQFNHVENHQAVQFQNLQQNDAQIALNTHASAGTDVSNVEDQLKKKRRRRTRRNKRAKPKPVVKPPEEMAVKPESHNEYGDDSDNFSAWGPPPEEPNPEIPHVSLWNSAQINPSDTWQQEQETLHHAEEFQQDKLKEPSVWVSASSQFVQQPSLSLPDIQAEEEVLRQQERDHRVQLQIQQEHDRRLAVESPQIGFQDTTNPAAWGSAQGNSQPSFLDIQREEHRKAQIESSRQNQTPQRLSWIDEAHDVRGDRRQIRESAWSQSPKTTAWNSTDYSVSQSTPLPPPQRESPRESTQPQHSPDMAWEHSVQSHGARRGDTVVNPPHETTWNVSQSEQQQHAGSVDVEHDALFWGKDAALNVPLSSPQTQPPPPVTRKKNKRNKKKATSPFGGPELSDSFEAWCKDQLLQITGSDDTTLVNFLMSIPDDDQIKDYIHTYLGDSAEIDEFAANFIQQKAFDTNANVVPLSQLPAERSQFEQVVSKKKKKSKKKKRKD